jgi:hypothetical protein
MKGLFWITDQIKLFFTKKNGYNNDSINIREYENQTFFQRVRNWFSNEPNYIALPLNEFEFVSRENASGVMDSHEVSINMDPYISSWTSTELYVPDSDYQVSSKYPPPPLTGVKIKEHSSSDFFHSSFIKKWTG